MEVEDQVQFTDVSKILIEHFHKSMNHLQYNEFVFVLVNNGDKVQWGISFVDDFVLLVLEEVAHFGFTGDDQLVYLH